MLSTPTVMMDSSAISTGNEFHPLNNKWNLYAHLPQDSDWTLKSYHQLCQFDTIEKVIAVTEVLPELFIKNCMLFIMREGVTPMWEDVQNRTGGCFSYRINNKYVREVWRDLSYCLAGNSLSSNDIVNRTITGITISPKKNFCIIKIWLSSCEFHNPSVIVPIGKFIVPAGCLFKNHVPEY